MGCFGRKQTEEEKALSERNKKIEKQIKDDKQKYKATHRLLLLGEYYLQDPSFCTQGFLMLYY